MEYPKKLQNLNLQELSYVLGIPFEEMLEVTSQKKELRARDIPVIITYGDLMMMASLSHKAADAMMKVIKGEKEPKSLMGMIDEMLSMFNYIYDVLAEGNINQEKVKEMLNIS